MKAIYINLDPYLAALAAWLKGGKSGPKPTFQPLPLAVTIPLGESAALYLIADCDVIGYEINSQEITLGGETAYIDSPDYRDPGLPEDTIALNEEPGFSSIAPALKYAVIPVSGSEMSVSYIISYGATHADEVNIPFTVLVRRETASGPVDLVDFTPPASAIAAGTDLKGTKFDGNEIVAAAGTGALSAPAGA